MKRMRLAGLLQLVCIYAGVRVRCGFGHRSCRSGRGALGDKRTKASKGLAEKLWWEAVGTRRKCMSGRPRFARTLRFQVELAYPQTRIDRG